MSSGSSCAPGKSGARRLDAALPLTAAIALVAMLVSLNRGVDLGDEAAHLYPLHHPEVVTQFLDHRLWVRVDALCGGTVVVCRVLSLSLVVASTLAAALAAVSLTGSFARRPQRQRSARMRSFLSGVGLLALAGFNLLGMLATSRLLFQSLNPPSEFVAGDLLRLSIEIGIVFAAVSLVAPVERRSRQPPTDRGLLA